MQKSNDWGSKIQGLMIKDQIIDHSMEDQIMWSGIKDQRINNPKIIGSKIKWLII